jgi:hypothetical protein
MELAIRLGDGEQGHASELLGVMVGIEEHHLGYAKQLDETVQFHITFNPLQFSNNVESIATQMTSVSVSAFGILLAGDRSLYPRQSENQYQ